MILWLASYPRSGNTFLRIILRDCFGLETYSESNDNRDIGATEALSTIVGHRNYTGGWDKFYMQSIQSSELIPIKTHSAPRDGEKAIYVIRDPFAAIVSHYHYYANFGRLSMSMEDIIVGATPAGTWGEHARKWRPQERENTLLIRFEEMVSSPDAVIDSIALFLGKEPSAVRFRSFEALQSSKPEFFRSGNNKKNSDELTNEQAALITLLNADVMDLFGYAPRASADLAPIAVRNLGVQVHSGKEELYLAVLRKNDLERDLKRNRTAVADAAVAKKELKKAQQRFQADVQAMKEGFARELSAQRKKVEAAVTEAIALKSRLAATEEEKNHLISRIAVTERALAPSLKSILMLRPLRFAFSEWRRIKAGGEHWRPLMPATPARHGVSAPNTRQPTADELIAAVKAKSDERQLPVAACKVQGMGVAVFGFDRAESITQVLHSLTLQGAAPITHVFIDGDQGRPAKRADIDLVHECARQFPVKAIYRNRGNFGFRKMMLLGMKTMMDRYEKLLFLEDDCFPVGGAVVDFSRELDAAADKPEICSVYGHHFLVPGEENGLARFQGWGWATTSTKLRPVWDELMRLYLMPEEEYLAFVARELTPEIARRIDVTPGRQPTDTIRKFFAWDEALCLIAALRGMKHQASSRRLVYNFGAGGKSSHFHAVDFYRKPPFNMVSTDEIWDHY